MSNAEILKALKQWQYDWINHLNIEDSQSPFSLGATKIKGFAVKRLSQLIKEIEG